MSCSLKYLQGYIRDNVGEYSKASSGEHYCSSLDYSSQDLEVFRALSSASRSMSH